MLFMARWTNTHVVGNVNVLGMTRTSFGSVVPPGEMRKEEKGRGVRTLPESKYCLSSIIITKTVLIRLSKMVTSA